MIYEINKSIILESELFEEEMSNIAKRGMQLGAAGVGLGMGHAGAFGGGVKSAIDTAGGMGANMADRGLSIAGNAMDHTRKFYSPAPEVAAPAVASANHAAGESSDAADGMDDDDSGLGVLGTIGAGTVAAGAGYLGLKGGKAANKAYQGSGMQKSVNTNAKNTRDSYSAGKRGMAQSGGLNMANRLGGVRRALGGK